MSVGRRRWQPKYDDDMPNPILVDSNSSPTWEKRIGCGDSAFTDGDQHVGARRGAFDLPRVARDGSDGQSDEKHRCSM